MRTQLPSSELKSPGTAEAEGIIQSCVHYGFCTNTCPTYVLTRDENESPRGRIELIRKMLENGSGPDEKTVAHLDSCLSCLSCMSTCAVKVDYAHLIDWARAHIENHYRRPLRERALRALLAHMLPRPDLFLQILGAIRLAKPLRRLFPRRLRTMMALIPDRIAPDLLSPTTLPAQGPRRWRVALLAGCVQQALNGDINAATINLLRRHGCEVVIAPGAGCCGSLSLHMGREDVARRFAQANVAAWIAEREIGLDAIIVNASGCGTTIKDYGHLLCDYDAQKIAGLTQDICEFLLTIGLQQPIKERSYRVAYHDPCSMQHGQSVVEQPRRLLRAAGYEVLDVPERHFCCGSAGTYNLLQPETAHQLGVRKARHITSTDPDIVATGNVGCMMQLQHHLGSPVVHTVELLDWATGGPRPAALAGIVLREPALRQAMQNTPTANGFW
ncbi:MAG TPA: glycolate oxidase subunit GlcF [Xanthobacteraceae bacterium]|jgi:glycolate oxidase iron-sulfur subunit|nr:glycolate oxidase subunit GlcF [Xanthobacteraceae bacterium]